MCGSTQEPNLPRLKLMATLVAARLVDFVTTSLTLTDNSIASRMWFNGPVWLLNQQLWLKWEQEPISHLHAVVAMTEEFTPNGAPPDSGLHFISVRRFSTLTKLLRVTVIVSRFIQALCNPATPLHGTITSVELSNVRIHWIHSCQHEVYWKEIKNLATSNHKPLPLARQLRLFLDGKGCGGHIHNAQLDDNTKFPCLLPPRHHFTRLIVYATHTKLYHAGVTNTVISLCQTFWIPTARQYVKSLLHHCTACRKHCGKPYTRPDPAPLPKNRVQRSTTIHCNWC